MMSPQRRGGGEKTAGFRSDFSRELLEFATKVAAKPKIKSSALFAFVVMLFFQCPATAPVSAKSLTSVCPVKVFQLASNAV
jgi:hypothetical protein